MSVITYRGYPSRTLYRFDTKLSLPAALQDALGNPLQQGSFNSETVVIANRDGSVARGVPGSPPSGDPYSFTVVPSPWESL